MTGDEPGFLVAKQREVTRNQVTDELRRYVVEHRDFGRAPELSEATIEILADRIARRLVG